MPIFPPRWQSCAGKGWNTKLIHSLKAKVHAMATRYDTDERRPHSKGPFTWWTGYRKIPKGWPQLRFKDVCKRDLQALGINTDTGEVTATDRDVWRYTAKVRLSQYEVTQRLKAEEKRLHKKTARLANRPTTPFICSNCDRDCHSQIGLHIHKRRCKMGANLWSFETDRC